MALIWKIGLYKRLEGHKEAVCLVCSEEMGGKRKVLKTGGGSTGAVIKHLRSVHKNSEYHKKFLELQNKDDGATYSNVMENFFAANNEDEESIKGMFTSEMEAHLMELYEQYSDIIEQKSRSEAVNHQRKAAYAEILDKMYAAFPEMPMISVEQIKCKLKRLLYDARKEPQSPASAQQSDDDDDEGEEIVPHNESVNDFDDGNRLDVAHQQIAPSHHKNRRKRPFSLGGTAIKRQQHQATGYASASPSKLISHLFAPSLHSPFQSIQRRYHHQQHQRNNSLFHSKTTAEQIEELKLLALRKDLALKDKDLALKDKELELKELLIYRERTQLGFPAAIMIDGVQYTNGGGEGGGGGEGSGGEQMMLTPNNNNQELHLLQQNGVGLLPPDEGTTFQ